MDINAMAMKKGQPKNHKPKGGYNGADKLSPAEVERYMREGLCFGCGSPGHQKLDCPKRQQGKGNWRQRGRD
jgi:hypothetical protein